MGSRKSIFVFESIKHLNGIFCQGSVQWDSTTLRAMLCAKPSDGNKILGHLDGSCHADCHLADSVELLMWHRLRGTKGNHMGPECQKGLQLKHYFCAFSAWRMERLARVASHLAPSQVRRIR